MTLLPTDLEHIAALTLEHYNLRAEDFREGTRDHDVSQNIAALLRHIDGAPPFTILDFGCGPGVTCAPSASLATPPSELKAPHVLLRWRVPIAAVKSGNRIF
ncbi:putative methyltransferase [Collimonas arenae]|uniref:Putative methyltransferase n=1 Tax=Collimonas arenae TaxID=279058 RepID=A0A127QH97_9BURK|nr:putative methyltransferase [Collimonas arenae]